ncbi:MAG: 16S rRNA (guanine(527)-N(7))-methyltransferase RsmG [Bacteroidetes bacterium QH_8_67_23]|nr:MAG: 16S rRNA (guanine(527)-N(7))-methyltransferase RsmG [Bacteroidetes bacterium QH_8_67_23]
MNLGRRLVREPPNPQPRGSVPFDPLAALSEEQRATLARFERLLVEFNGKINLISRPSEPRVRTEHTLHSLALAWKGIPPGAQVVDFGAGGGLPAVPLAIRFPRAQFTAVDANGKKTRAVRAMGRRLALDNLTARKSRAEAWSGVAGWSVSRATAPLAELWRWHRRAFQPPDEPPRESDWPPGLLALKGGDLSEERAALKEAFPDARVETHPLGPLLGRDGFAEKRIVAVQAETTAP